MSDEFLRISDPSGKHGTKSDFPHSHGIESGIFAYFYDGKNQPFM